jgi:hypothetical protein
MQRKNLDRQTEIGKEQQDDALNRTRAYSQLLRKQRGAMPNGLMPTMGDDELAALFAGDMP